jgi:hypothetical protein
MKEQEYYRITYELTTQAASTLTRLNPEMTFCYISRVGTDRSERSPIMRARVEEKTENKLATLPSKAAYSFLPGLMKPTMGQQNVKPIFKALGSLYPLSKIIFPKSVSTLEELDLSMIHVVRPGHSKCGLENVDIA